MGLFVFRSNTIKRLFALSWKLASGLGSKSERWGTSYFGTKQSLRFFLCALQLVPVHDFNDGSSDSSPRGSPPGESDDAAVHPIVRRLR